MLWSRADELFRSRLDEPLYLAEAEAQRPFSALRRFQCAIPETVVDIDRAYLDIVFSGIADDLCRGVEPHRLAIEQGTGEDLGIEAFDPGRDVDKQRKARRVAFGKAVGPEPFDLAETAGCEIAVVAVSDHAGDEFAAEQMNVAVAFEGRHGAAQPVRVFRRKAGADNGDLHRLLLKERHAQ